MILVYHNFLPRLKTLFSGDLCSSRKQAGHFSLSGLSVMSYFSCPFHRPPWESVLPVRADRTEGIRLFSKEFALWCGTSTVPLLYRHRCRLFPTSAPTGSMSPTAEAGPPAGEVRSVFQDGRAVSRRGCRRIPQSPAQRIHPFSGEISFI